jgi:hypothetical protein
MDVNIYNALHASTVPCIYSVENPSMRKMAKNKSKGTRELEN